MSNYQKKLKTIAQNTDDYLKSLFVRQKFSSYLIKPMMYSVFSGGKRFRSTIIVNTGMMLGVNYKKLIVVGAAVECIHSYSLIHDDLPSMDNDDFRRGRLSTHKKFSESTAILAGNSLLTLAFEILSSKDLNLSKEIKTELIRVLSNCSGHSGIAGGQFEDLNFENKNILKKDIIEMQNKKTGRLFGFCCESVSIIKQENKRKRNLLKNIGLNIGLLFQIADDLLDCKGDSKTLGKPTQNDKKKGKINLINIFGYNGTLNYAKRLKKNLDAKIKKYGNKSRDLLESVEFVLDRDF